MNSHLPKLMFSSIYLLNKDSLRPWNRNEVYNFEQTLTWCLVSSYIPQETILLSLNILELPQFNNVLCVHLHVWGLDNFLPFDICPFLFFHYITEETRSKSVLRYVWLSDSVRDPQLKTPQILKINKQTNKDKITAFQPLERKDHDIRVPASRNGRIGHEIPHASLLPKACID